MPIVTRIVPTRRDPRRQSVYLDGQFAFALNVNVLARFKLQAGLELSPQQVESIQRGEVRQKCLDDGLRCLQVRMHSRRQLLDKLKRRDYTLAMINQTLDDLQRLGYLDDERFALAKASSAAERRRHGRRRAKMELIKAGVAESVAEKALDAVYDASDSLATARELALKQAPRLKRLEPQAARRRLAGMLQRRGFDYEVVRPVIDQVLGSSDPGLS